MNHTSSTEAKSLAKVSVGMKADSLDPADITRMVGVQPTRAVTKGEPSQRMKVPAPWGIWAYETSSGNVEHAAADMLREIEPMVTQLRAAAAKYNAELTVSIYWQPEGGQGGYSLPADVVRRLSVLGERIDFYFA